MARDRLHEECRGCPREFADPPECEGHPPYPMACSEKPNGCVPVIEEHYGAKVWTDRETDALRRERCLCLRCARDLKTCKSAIELYMLCRSKNLALMVTRCPRFAGEEG